MKENTQIVTRMQLSRKSQKNIFQISQLLSSDFSGKIVFEKAEDKWQLNFWTEDSLIFTVISKEMEDCLYILKEWLIKINDSKLLSSKIVHIDNRYFFKAQTIYQTFDYENVSLDNIFKKFHFDKRQNELVRPSILCLQTPGEVTPIKIMALEESILAGDLDLVMKFSDQKSQSFLNCVDISRLYLIDFPLFENFSDILLASFLFNHSGFSLRVRVTDNVLYEACLEDESGNTLLRTRYSSIMGAIMALNHEIKKYIIRGNFILKKVKN